MSRCLVTGCAGLIGWRVASLLLDGGNEVVGLDSLDDSYSLYLKQWRLNTLLRKSQFEFKNVDISQREALRAVINGEIATVFHLAARAGVRSSVRNPGAYIAANVVGTTNVLDSCAASGIHNVILASTSSLYQSTPPGGSKETDPTDRPLSPYAATKKAAEAMAHSYHHIQGLNIVVLRYFTVYGPAGRPDMGVFRFVRQISEETPVTVYGDGMQTRDFTYVDDIAHGTIRAAQLGSGFEIINLGSDRPAQVNDVIRILEGAIGKRANVQYSQAHAADVPSTWANIDKAKELLDWEPSTRLQVGLERAVAWYSENRDWIVKHDI